MSSEPARPEYSMDQFRFRMLIGEELVESESKRWFSSIDPSTEEELAQIPLGSAKDVERAVAVAEEAQPGWAALSIAERAERLRNLADAVAKRADEILYLECSDTGNAIYKMTKDVTMGLDEMRYYAGLGYELKGSTIPATAGNLHITIREPYGVVGRIVPWNHPILFALMKVGAPLIAGNTVVLKPSLETSLSTCIFGEICQEVLPPGVLNIVTGSGSEVGEALVRHPRVKRLALVGSVETGMRIQHSAAEVAVKHITLELGGKNPMIVFPDADLAKATQAAIDGMNLAWQGQSCGSTSRLLLHESIHDEVLEGVVGLASSLRIGAPLAWDTQVGPINNKNQYEKVVHYVQAGKEDGARLVCGGRRPSGAQFERGYWFQPTVFADAKRGMRIAQEEIFGPVITVMKWKTEDELKDIVNSVQLGLTATIWTQDLATALKTAKWVRSGFVSINAAPIHYPAVPFGGYWNSGIDREEGLGELLSYTEEKVINIIL
jgi:betaine-aldehyde dehydrogenase